MMICYSMESILTQLGFPLCKRKQHVKEPFLLTIPPEYMKVPLFANIKNPMTMRRNHTRYFPSRLMKGPLIEPIASYKGESMVALYKNSILIQFHPEKSPDGKKLILNWLGLA